MKSETAVQALQRGVPPEVLAQLTGDAHPTPRELAEFKESGGVSHTATGGTSTVRSQHRRARSSFNSFSFPETRLGVCVGLDTACILGGIHVDFTGEVLGFKIGASGFPVLPFFNASLRTYGNRATGETTAPYLYAGVAYGLAITYGGGIWMGYRAWRQSKRRPPAPGRLSDGLRVCSN